MKKPSLFNAKIPMPVEDSTIALTLIYLVASCLVYEQFSKLVGIALFVNAVLALVIGMVARSMGKREGAVVILGLLIGPLGGLAGLIAAPAKR